MNLGAAHPGPQEAVMRTYYVFQAVNNRDLRGYTYDAAGDTLPVEDGPWTLVRQISPDEEWTEDVSRAVVAAGILENGVYLWGPINRPTASKPIIESDRVEGTAVFDPEGNQVGTIKRLLIEKVSGRVLYVDVTFGGFLGIGAHHHTIPWERLAYDRQLAAYSTDVTEEEVRAAPAFYGADQIWPDPKREKEIQDYWRAHPKRGG
jgi:hypothetical protein